MDKYPCEVGIEIELEELPYWPIIWPKNREHIWEIKKDGSLRGDTCAEFVLKTPLINKKDIFYALRLLENHVTLATSLFSKRILPLCSERTSVHIHLDMSKRLGIDFIRNLLGYSILMESLWFAFFKKFYNVDRSQNHFCISFKDCGEQYKEFANNLMKASSQPSVRTAIIRIFKTFPRYTAINAQSLYKFGSLEYRHHPGEFKAKHIFAWINTLTRLVDICSQDEYQNIENVPIYISQQGYIPFLNKIYSQEETKYLPFFSVLSKDEIEFCMEEGVSNSQELFELPNIQKSSEAIHKQYMHMKFKNRKISSNHRKPD